MTPSSKPTLGESALVIGGSGGLGKEIVSSLVKRGVRVITTVRSTPKPDTFPHGVIVIDGVDLGEEGGGADALEKGIAGAKVDLVIVAAGLFKSDSLSTLNWNDQIDMFKTCVIGPSFLAARLHALDTIRPGGKLLLLTSESGSIALRTVKEGGAQYGHHASKAAQNMLGRLLSIDFKEKNVAVVDVHPGFMRTSMTKNVGFDEFWDSGGAVEPDVAAESLIDFAESVTMEHTGKFIAPRGAGDVGTAEEVMGKSLKAPLELPW